MDHPLFALLRKLEDNGHYFELSRQGPESVLISVTLPGERLEIDVFEDGHVEYLRFIGDEEVLDDPAVLDQLIKEE